MLGATLGGFMIAGGQPMVLVQISEIVVICGVTLGLIIVGTPLPTLIATIKSILGLLSGDGPGKNDFLELLKMLYEMFTLGRRNGLIALDEHVEDPAQSSIMSKYTTFVKSEERKEFLINNLRPLIDGKIKPEQIGTLMHSEIKNKHEKALGLCTYCTSRQIRFQVSGFVPPFSGSSIPWESLTRVLEPWVTTLQRPLPDPSSGCGWPMVLQVPRLSRAHGARQ